MLQMIASDFFLFNFGFVFDYLYIYYVLLNTFKTWEIFQVSVFKLLIICISNADLKKKKLDLLIKYEKHNNDNSSQ